MQEVFEKIIERLEENQTIVFHLEGGKPTQSIDLVKAIEIVKQAAEEYNNGWIPCSERLPEEKINPITDDFYMYPVMYKDGNVTDIKYLHFGNGHWHHGFKIMDNYVTHWMDIKPYNQKFIQECANPASQEEREELNKKIRSIPVCTYQTNADRIRSMSDEELAMNMMCPNENGLGEIECDKSDNCNCYECLLKWLQSEVEEHHGNEK